MPVPPTTEVEALAVAARLLADRIPRDRSETTTVTRGAPPDIRRLWLAEGEDDSEYVY